MNHNITVINGFSSNHITLQSCFQMDTELLNYVANDRISSHSWLTMFLGKAPQSGFLSPVSGKQKNVKSRGHLEWSDLGFVTLLICCSRLAFSLGTQNLKKYTNLNGDFAWICMMGFIRKLLFLEKIMYVGHQHMT